MTDRIQQGSLQIAAVLHELLENDIAPGTGISPQQFWPALESIVNDLAPRNTALLQTRGDHQTDVDLRRDERVDDRGGHHVQVAVATEAGVVHVEGHRLAWPGQARRRR